MADAAGDKQAGAGRPPLHAIATDRPQIRINEFNRVNHTRAVDVVKHMSVEQTTRDPGKTGQERHGGEHAEGRGAPPYLGLAAFGEAGADRFFGREDVTELVAFLAEQRPGLPLMLVGASGAGKTSL